MEHIVIHNLHRRYEKNKNNIFNYFKILSLKNIEEKVKEIGKVLEKYK